jgi:hypothetical protein
MILATPQFVVRVRLKGCKGLLEALYLKDDIGQVVGGRLCRDAKEEKVGLRTYSYIHH